MGQHMGELGGVIQPRFEAVFKLVYLVCLPPAPAVDAFPSRLTSDDLCVMRGHTCLQGMSDEQQPASVCQYITQTHDIGSGRSMQCTQMTML